MYNHTQRKRKDTHVISLHTMYTMPNNLLLAFSQGTLRGFTECANHCNERLGTAVTEEILMEAKKKYHHVWTAEKGHLSYAKIKRPPPCSGQDWLSPGGDPSSDAGSFDVEATLRSYLPAEEDELAASYLASPAARSAGSNAGQVAPSALLSTFDLAAFSPLNNPPIPKVSNLTTSPPCSTYIFVLVVSNRSTWHHLPLVGNLTRATQTMLA